MTATEQTMTLTNALPGKLRKEEASDNVKDPRETMDSLNKYKLGSYADTNNGKYTFKSTGVEPAVMVMDSMGVAFLAKRGFRMTVTTTCSEVAQPCVPIGPDALFHYIKIADKDDPDNSIMVANEGYHSITKRFLKNLNYSKSFMDTGIHEIYGHDMFDIISADTSERYLNTTTGAVTYEFIYNPFTDTFLDKMWRFFDKTVDLQKMNFQITFGLAPISQAFAYDSSTSNSVTATLAIKPEQYILSVPDTHDLRDEDEDQMLLKRFYGRTVYTPSSTPEEIQYVVNSLNIPVVESVICFLRYKSDVDDVNQPLKLDEMFLTEEVDYFTVSLEGQTMRAQENSIKHYVTRQDQALRLLEFAGRDFKQTGLPEFHNWCKRSTTDAVADMGRMPLIMDFSWLSNSITGVSGKSTNKKLEINIFFKSALSGKVQADFIFPWSDTLVWDTEETVGDLRWDSNIYQQQ